MKAFPPNLNRSPAAWNLPTLNINADQITANTLSAISAFLGTLVINKGGSVSSGQTSYATGVGFWLGTDANGNPQFSLIDAAGNFITFNGASGNPLAISSAALANALSSLQSDDAGWSQTAIYSLITGLPTTLGGYGITDAQPALPLSTAIRQSLFSDNGGAPYWANEYDTNFNSGFDLPANVTTSSGSFVTISDVFGCPNPGQAINIFADVVMTIVDNTATSTGAEVKIQYSLNGGSTWTDGPIVLVSMATNTANYPLTASLAVSGVTPTGDVQFRVQGMSVASTSITFKNMIARAWLTPVSNFYIISPLAASVPASASMNCSATFPVTTCTASGNVICTPSGGLGPFTFSWAKVSGTGTITSGSTSQTCTISDTETTADGGVSHTTTVNCTVQDSQTYTPTAGSDAANVATVTIGAHNIPVGAVVNISGCTPAAYNVTNAVVTAITTTQIKYATLSTPGAMTGFGTVNAVRITTGNCVETGTFFRVYNPIGGTITPNGGSCKTTTCGQNCTANGSATANPSGGNGSYTFSWSVTSGPATITSGSTSQTCNFHDTEASSNPPLNGTSSTSFIRCVINDTRGTGAATRNSSITMRFSCPAT